MLFKKEKEVIELVLKHLDTVETCIKTGIETVTRYLEGNIQEGKKLARNVSALETEADMVRHQIRDKLYSGAYLPHLREDVYRLVRSIDSVANAGEACCNFFLNQRPSIPDELRGDFLGVTRESLGIIDPLKLAVVCYFKGECKIDVLRGYSKDVGFQESQVDKEEWDLTKKIFISTLDFSRKLHLKLCLDSIVEVSDRAENAADQLELVALKAIM
ncbi:MAG TPA: DUF47 domain-containing protein [Desulfobacteraceae bacterium]|nr:MAG: hypothetical protein DRG82_14945 [Deltaproteobacteria bacterium]HDZ24201.1 DUF47 domain-containing protein [Desulfobacteraceae bacterium]